jgi:hypothetical protein
MLVAPELADTQAFARKMAALEVGQVLQEGEPARSCYSPTVSDSRRSSATWSFAAVSGQPGIMVGIHADRLVGDTAPGRLGERPARTAVSWW